MRLTIRLIEAADGYLSLPPSKKKTQKKKVLSKISLSQNKDIHDTILSPSHKQPLKNYPSQGRINSVVTLIEKSYNPLLHYKH